MNRLLKTNYTRDYIQPSNLPDYGKEPHNIPMNTMWAFVQNDVLFSCIMFIHIYIHYVLLLATFGYIVFYMHIYIIYLEPKYPLVQLEKTFFWRQNKGQMGSRYIMVLASSPSSWKILGFFGRSRGYQTAGRRCAFREISGIFSREIREFSPDRKWFNDCYLKSPSQHLKHFLEHLRGAEWMVKGAH